MYFVQLNDWLVLIPALMINNKMDVNYQSSLKCYWAPSTFDLSQPENLNLNFLDKNGESVQTLQFRVYGMSARRILIVVKLCSVTENLQPLLGLGSSSPIRLQHKTLPFWSCRNLPRRHSIMERGLFHSIILGAWGESDDLLLVLISQSVLTVCVYFFSVRLCKLVSLATTNH